MNSFLKVISDFNILYNLINSFRSKILKLKSLSSSSVFNYIPYFDFSKLDTFNIIHTFHTCIFYNLTLGNGTNEFHEIWYARGFGGVKSILLGLILRNLPKMTIILNEMANQCNMISLQFLKPLAAA